MTVKILTVGHACLDFVHEVDALPDPAIKVPSKSLQVKLGGNAAIAAACLVKLGAQADLCSVLGNRIDWMTQQLVSLLETSRVGIDCAFLESQPCPVSNVLILPNGDRAISSFQPGALTCALHRPDDLTQYAMVLGDTNRLQQTRQLIVTAKLAGVPTMLDVDKPIDKLQDIPQADIVFFSSESWKLLEEDGVSLSEAQRYLGGVVGITNGAEPIIYSDAQGKWHERMPEKVEPLTTLGAGDAWRAGLAMALVSGYGIHDAIHRACQTAAEHIQKLPLTRITGETHETI